MVLGRWRDRVEGGFAVPGWDGVPQFLILGMNFVAMGGALARPASCVLGCFVASTAIFFSKSERRLSFRLCDPGEPPQPEVAGGSGRRVLSRGLAAHYLARRWCTTTLVALRGGCPPSRAVRRPAFAVTVSSVIRGGDEPRGELSVLARKRSGDRGDLSFPVVTGIG